MSEPQVTKKRVTLTSHPVVRGELEVRTVRTDYIREDFLDAFVEHAQEVDGHTGLPRYAVVEVSGEYDAGPGGYHGQTHVPHYLRHPLAGQTFPATTPEEG